MQLNQWHKAEKSGSGSNCVEVMQTEDGFRVRDTKDGGEGPVLSFNHDEWDAFLDGVGNGEFNSATR